MGERQPVVNHNESGGSGRGEVDGACQRASSNGERETLTQIHQQTRPPPPPGLPPQELPPAIHLPQLTHPPLHQPLQPPTHPPIHFPTHTYPAYPPNHSRRHPPTQTIQPTRPPAHLPHRHPLSRQPSTNSPPPSLPTHPLHPTHSRSHPLSHPHCAFIFILLPLIVDRTPL